MSSEYCNIKFNYLQNHVIMFVNIKFDYLQNHVIFFFESLQNHVILVEFLFYFI